MPTSYDVIVLGIGGVGSATLYQLANRGLRVLGIEQFSVPNDRGSSHGETRAIRKAYFEHANYVPLLQRSYRGWRDLEKCSGESGLLVEQGMLEIGPPDGELIRGVRRSCREHGLALEDVDEQQFAKRFPGFALPQGCVAVFEPEGGYLHVERCVASFAEQAVRLGADLLTDERVCEWQTTGSGVQVQTESHRFLASRLIITAGAWAGEALRKLNVELQILRKHLHWYAAEPKSYLQSAGSPVFFYERPEGYFYGFPSLTALPNGQQCIKIAEHSGGEKIEHPEQLKPTEDAEVRDRVESFLSECLRDVVLEAQKHQVCMYTLSSDGHFLVDQHPEHDAVSFAAGLSGHGFKFAPVLGEVLADLAQFGQTDLPIDFLRLR